MVQNPQLVPTGPGSALTPNAVETRMFGRSPPLYTLPPHVTDHICPVVKGSQWSLPYSDTVIESEGSVRFGLTILIFCCIIRPTL